MKKSLIKMIIGLMICIIFMTSCSIDKVDQVNNKNETSDIEKAYNKLLNDINPLNYILYDIDKDNSYELIALFEPATEEAAMNSKWFGNMYTYKNNEVVKLENNLMLINAYELEGDLVFDIGEGGIVTYFKVPYDSNDYEWYLDSDHTCTPPTYILSGEKISEEEFESYVNRLKDVEIYETINREPLKNCR